MGKVEKYSGAPYNFVPFCKTPFEIKPSEQVAHDLVDPERLSGEISIQITAKQDIFVSDGVKDNADFTKNQYGQYAIPGSTIRGLIRNNVQILGLSSLADDIADYKMMYREVAGGEDRIDRKRYGDILGADQVTFQGHEISVLKNVKAGYIKRECGKYYICKTVLDKIDDGLGEINYYILNERHLIDTYVDKGKSFPEFSFFFSKPQERLQHKPYTKFKKEGNKARTQYKGEPNKAFHPYYAKVSYKISNLRNVTSVKERGTIEGGLDGYVIVTGVMQQKKAIYIIPEIDLSKPRIELTPEQVKMFRVDFERRKNGLKPREFFDLPEEGKEKPVFYIDSLDQLYFGFTPRLRLFDAHTIKDGLLASHKDCKFDFAKSLFGYSSNVGSYKTRLSFSDAVLTKQGKGERNSDRIILAEPKPSSYADYLVQEGKRVIDTYNTTGTQLRGVKQYWLHDSIVPQKPSDKEKIKVMIRPLPAESVFAGKVRFKNLSRVELGLLLWSIRLEDNSWINLGLAKPYGYGAAKMEILSVSTLDEDKAYAVGAGSLALNVLKDRTGEISSLIEEYKKYVESHSAIRFDKEESIRQFFLMKDSTMMPKAATIAYMDVNKGNYRNRDALQTIPELAGNRDGRNVRNAGSTRLVPRFSLEVPELTSVESKPKVDYPDDAISATIDSFNAGKHYGFVTYPGKKYFFHINAVKNAEPADLKSGVKVKVRIGKATNGKIQAIELWVCN